MLFRSSSIGIGSLLWAGIGDTIRVSLSAEPEEEVRVGFEMLKALNLRHRGVNIISCPSCARQQYDVIRTVEALEKRVAHITTPMTVSVIGCVVNGPGEARETDIGFTGGGNGTHQVYIAGQPHHRLKDKAIVDHLVELVEAKAAEIARDTDAAARREYARLSGARSCRTCGCTDQWACEGGCEWINADLCSTCDPTIIRMGGRTSFVIAEDEAYIETELADDEDVRLSIRRGEDTCSAVLTPAQAIAVATKLLMYASAAENDGELL